MRRGRAGWVVEGRSFVSGGRGSWEGGVRTCWDMDGYYLGGGRRVSCLRIFMECYNLISGRGKRSCEKRKSGLAGGNTFAKSAKTYAK